MDKSWRHDLLLRWEMDDDYTVDDFERDWGRNQRVLTPGMGGEAGRDWEASYDDLGISFLGLGAVVLEVCNLIKGHPEDELLSDIMHRLEAATSKASELPERRYLEPPSQGGE